LKSFLLFLVFAILASVVPFASSVSAEESLSISNAPKVTKEQIKDLVGTRGFFLLDVRPNEQWNATQVKLPGAVHEDPEDVKDWVYKYQKDAKIVTYCA
jgi:hypothetical protein